MRFVGAYSVPTNDPDDCMDIAEEIIGDDDTGEFVIFSVEEGTSYIVVSLADFPKGDVREASAVPTPYVVNAETVYETEWIDPPTSSLGRKILQEISDEISKDTSLESDLSPTSKVYFEKTHRKETIDKLPRKSAEALRAAKKALASSGTETVLKRRPEKTGGEGTQPERSRRPMPSKTRGRSSGDGAEESIRESRAKNLERHRSEVKETEGILNEFLG